MYDDGVDKEMVNPWGNYVEVGEACFDPYDEQSTRDSPYGGRSLPKDRVGAPSAHPPMLNYGNHNGAAMDIDHIRV